MIVKIIFLVFSLVGLINTEARAQLFLEQGKLNLSVSGGEHTNGALMIHNTSSEQINIKVYWEDFEYKSPYDGTKEFLPAGTAPTSVSQWVTFSPQTFTLPAFGQQKIDYSVSVPDTIKEGHYGVLFFEKSSEATLGNSGVNLVTRVGCLFFVEPKDKNKNAVLQNVALKGDKVTVDFVNQGNIILIPHSTFYMMQDGGLVLLRGDAKKAYVPPGASATVEVPLKDKLKPGKYTLVVNSDLEEGDVVVKEIGLEVDASGQLTTVNTQE